MAGTISIGQLNLQTVTGLTASGSGYIGFNAKSDGLYQKINSGTDTRLATTTDLLNYVPTGRTVSAGSGLSGGGNLSGNITISHAVGTAVSLNSNNSNGVVIQDITIANNSLGHLTGATVGTIDLDSRYYTETESNAKFLNLTGGTLTGGLTINGAINNVTTITGNKGSAGTLLSLTDGVNSSFVVSTTSLVTTIGNGGGSTALGFKANNTEYMRLTSGGSLGLGAGNTAPARALHVSTTGAVPMRLQTTGSNTGIELLGDATRYNFFVGKQYNVSDTFEITPSTTAGGTTFSTPAFTVNYNGDATIAGTLDVGYSIVTNELTNYGDLFQYGNSNNYGDIIVSKTAPKLMLTDSNLLTVSVASEVSGKLADFGTNYSQGGARNAAYLGGYLRIDTRPEYPTSFFTLHSIPANGSDTILFRVGSNGNATIAGNLTVNGNITATGEISAYDAGSTGLDTAPATSTSTGTTGERRFCSDAIYICTATNQWKKLAYTTF